MWGSGIFTGVEYDFFTGDGVRTLCTLLWLESVATEKADLDDDDDQPNEPSDELDVPDAGRANIFGPAGRVDACTCVVTGELGVDCDPNEDPPPTSCVVSSIK